MRGFFACPLSSAIYHFTSFHSPSITITTILLEYFAAITGGCHFCITLLDYQKAIGFSTHQPFTSCYGPTLVTSSLCPYTFSPSVHHLPSSLSVPFFLSIIPISSFTYLPIYFISCTPPPTRIRERWPVSFRLMSSPSVRIWIFELSEED